MDENVRELDLDKLFDGRDRGRATAPGDGGHLGKWRGSWDERAKVSPVWERAALAFMEALEIEQDARDEAEEAAKDKRLTLQGQHERVSAYVDKNVEKVIGIGLSVVDLEDEAAALRAELVVENLPIRR